MVRYGVETRLKPEEVVRRAGATFGEGGLGLQVVDQNPRYVHLAGYGGHVSVGTSSEVKRTTVELETREWDYHVKPFMRKIGPPR